MKLLVISDIHANIWALDAVLKAEKDFDLVCCAGDYTDYGIAPVEVIDRMRALKSAYLVYGNHDIHVLNIYRSGEWMNVKDGDYKWVHYNCERLESEEISWLSSLPETLCFEVDGWQYCIQHQFDNAYGVIECRDAFDRFWKEKTELEDYSKKRRVIFGHTHRQCIHILDEDMQWLNPGSVSYRRPDDPDKTAHYAVITDGEIKLKRINYDRLPQFMEARKYCKDDRMMRTEIQDFMFFFGEARTSREPLEYCDDYMPEKVGDK